MISSLEEYRAAEKEMKELLDSLSSAGDLVDLKDLSGANDDGNSDTQSVSAKIAVLRDDLKSYRAAHPEEFNS